LYAGRTYDDEEDTHRKEIFATNMKKIEMHNYLHSKGLKSYRLGITPFADMVSGLESVSLLSNSRADNLFEMYCDV